MTAGSGQRPLVPAASVDRWPAPPLGALAAAMAATQRGRWSEAALLWRDLWRCNRPDPLAAACAAEAALLSGQLGFADHMLAQLPQTPRYLEELIAATEPVRRARMDLRDRIADPVEEPAAGRPENEPLKGLGEPERAPITPAQARSRVAEFFRDHPLARLADRELVRQVNDGICPLPRAFEAEDDEGTLHERHAVVPPRSRKIVHETVSKVRKWLAATDSSGAAPLQAGLYHELGLGTFAQMLLSEALVRCDDQDERRALRRQLAGIATDRDRLLDHAGELHPEDFHDQQARAARGALLAHFKTRHGDIVPVAPEPLINAFDFLLSGPVSDVERYTPANRLLLVGSRLACGGTELLLANTYRHFSRSGDFDAVDMALLRFEIGTPSAHYAAHAGLRKRDVVVLEPGYRADLPFSLLPGDWKARGQKLFDHIAATRPRVVHAWDDPTGILAAFAALAAGCPRVVIHLHHCSDAALSRPLEAVASYPAVFRRLVDLPQFEFAFCSNAAAEDYASWWAIPQPTRFHTVYNGYDWSPSRLSKAEAKRRIGIPETAAVVGTVIRFTPVKQPLLWAEAAIKLAAGVPSAHFVMVGDGWLRNRVEDEFANAGLRSRLHLPGEVGDVPDYLAAMDLFWLTSRTEGLSIVLVEAQYAGVPVLAFDCGGPRETFVDGETGILIPQDDTDRLADRSRSLLRDHKWLTEAGRHGRMHAEQKFTARGFFEGLKLIYDA